MVTTDPRKPRKLNPGALNALVADVNTYGRNLLGDILRNLDVTRILNARDPESAFKTLVESPVDVILLNWDETDTFDALGFVRTLRRLADQRLKRLPVVLVTSGLTRERVVAGRDAGADEFLSKPISPTALRQRLEMVVETPRPFVLSEVYLGPCRRRKNPAEYHGAKRRAGDNVPAAPMVDHDILAQEEPMRVALSRVRQACATLDTDLAATIEQVRAAKNLAVEIKDHALHAGLASFEAYISVAVAHGQTDDNVISTALTALEQLAALPLTFADARDSVALALGKAIQKKLAA